MATKRRKSKPARSRRAPKPTVRAAEPPSAADVPEAPSRSDIVIVGVGASAGGLEAFSQLLQSLPKAPGFAMVFVQHLAPQHESALPFLLAGRTDLDVVQATEGIEVLPNHVYVIPPNIQMGIQDGRLHLMPRPSDRSQYTPVDFFLHSLAEAVQDRAIAVILSGTASDGALGIRDVKSVGGITIAQKPKTAKYDGMPYAAINTGLVDLVLSPSEIAHELVAIASHPLRRSSEAPTTRPFADSPVVREEDLEQVFGLLRASTGVDFRRYKRPTIERRLLRRMVLQKIARVAQYLAVLRDNPAEVQGLYQDLLIHVTRFFRDADTFTGISALLPKLLEGLTDDQPVRVWVPGCSTGEEAYSIAMCVVECLDGASRSVPVQVFATDISDAAIDQARRGFYSEAAVKDVSHERLRRFFGKVEGGYRINKTVRDFCVFARQDLTRDPPFSKLDLILCRNVLIYMGADLQKRLMGIFHYALKPTGFLVLGAAETIGSNADLFMVAEKKHHIYQKKVTAPTDVRFPLDYAATAVHAPEPLPRRNVRPNEVKTAQGEANRLIQETYAPPGVIVDSTLNVVQFRGQTGAFLEPAPGDPSMNVLKMAREGLLGGLRAAIQEARRKRTRVSNRGVRVRSNGGWREVDVEVFPLGDVERQHLMILFDGESIGGRSGRRRAAPPRPEAPIGGRKNAQVFRLEQELAASREHLQSIIQELEAANEELQSANEEVLSANEELQSTNEELDTAKEELQSTNEELNTVNEELHGRNDELSRLNSDLMNLLGSVQIAIVIIANDLRIRRFTPMAERLLNLLPTDVGRPIGHIKPNIQCPDLEELIMRSIDTIGSIERRVQDGDGNWYALRIRPYRDVDNRIDGAVLALFDVSTTQAGSDAPAQTRRVADGVLQVVEQPVALLDRSLGITAANRAFRTTFGLDDEDVRGRKLLELGDGDWDAPALRTQLERTAGGNGGDGFELRHTFPSIGAESVVRARRIGGGDDAGLVILTVEPADDRRAPK